MAHKDTSDGRLKGAQANWDAQYGDIYEVNLNALGDVNWPPNAPWIERETTVPPLGDINGPRTMAGARRIHSRRK